MDDSRFTFKGQRSDEVVRSVVRRHPIVFFWPLLQATLALAITVAVFVYFDLGAVFYIVGGLSVLFGFGVIFKVSFLFKNSFCLITNQRVVNVDQRGFFDRRITETDYAKIQDVTNTTSGIIGTTFNIGNIIIQTAGTQNQLTIKKIPDPYQVQQEITKNIQR